VTPFCHWWAEQYRKLSNSYRSSRPLVHRSLIVIVQVNTSHPGCIVVAHPVLMVAQFSQQENLFLREKARQHPLSSAGQSRNILSLDQTEQESVVSPSSTDPWW